MKGYLWTLVVALMLGTSVAAGAQVPKFGATAGVNFSEVTDILGLQSRTGLIIGGFITYDIIGPLAVRPELLFSMKGYKANIQLWGGGEDIVDATLNYVELPVLVDVGIPFLPISPFNAHLFAGPDFAYRVGADSKVTLNGQPIATDIAAETNTFDFNIAVGGGLGLPVGPTTLGIELRYTFGTGSVFKSGGTTARNRVLSIMTSLSF